MWGVPELINKIHTGFQELYPITSYIGIFVLIWHHLGIDVLDYWWTNRDRGIIIYSYILKTMR